jgi:hypothetical protein
MNNKSFHILIAATLVILGVILLKVLMRHYWLMFFIWLLLPLIQIWLAGDVMKEKLTEELHKSLKALLFSVAIVLSIMNALNHEDIQHSVGKKYIDGYRIVKSYDCEAPESFDGSQAGEAPDVCNVEELSHVAWYSRIILYLIELGIFSFAFLIPAFIYGSENTSSAGKRANITDIPEKTSETLSESKLESVVDVLHKNFEGQHEVVPKINAANSIEVVQGYNYSLMKKLTMDEAVTIGSTYSRWRLLIAAIKDGDELWTYNAEGNTITNSFDHMYGIALVRERKIVHQLLINAWDDCHGL